jgi:glycerophosphoryl diester phosphodiesterase
VEHREKFAPRRATRVVNGRRVTDWFADDLTLRQLRRLHAEERDPQLRKTSAAYADKRHIRVPTLRRVVRLAERRGLGMLIETKHEDYLASRGIDLAGMLIAYLKRHRLSVQVWMHSFDSATARRLARELPYPVAQLVTKDSQVKRAGQRDIARYADAIAAPRTLVGRRRTSWAHRLGLQMFTWTFADDRDAHPKRRYRNACRDRIDGVITDSPRTAARMVG